MTWSSNSIYIFNIDRIGEDTSDLHDDYDYLYIKYLGLKLLKNKQYIIGYLIAPFFDL